VPELVRGQLAEASCPQRRVEDAAPPVPEHQYAAAGGGENEVGRGLAGAGLGQRVDERPGDGDGRALVGPRGADDHDAVDFDDRFLDVQAAEAVDVTWSNGRGSA
jgi:hypothetical protein